MNRNINKIINNYSPRTLRSQRWIKNVTNRYAYGKSRINQINQGTPSFYLYDNPGRSVTALVDDTESLLNNYEYDSFGNMLAESETTGNRFNYVG